MAEFEVNGHKYLSDKMNGMVQFHVMRKLLPVVDSFNDIRAAISTDEKGERKIDLLTALGPLSKAIAALPKDDCDFVLQTCLSHCKRDMGKGLGFATVWIPGANRPQYDDIDLVIMLQIVGNVLVENFGNFFPGGLLTSSPNIAANPSRG